MPRGFYLNGNKGLFKKGMSPWNKGKKGLSTSKKGKTKEHYPRLSNAGRKIGSVPWNKGKRKTLICKICKNPFWGKTALDRKKYCSSKCKSKFQVWNKGKENPQLMGENNPNWKGGITSENDKIRKSLEYAIWRNEVYRRDNWTCRLCDKKCGKNIIAHHIKLFSEFPELRFSVDNGITLCRSCHAKLHK